MKDGLELVVLLALSWLSWKAYALLRPRSQHTLRSVAILVLGDIGRSPRMMYHAQSFAEHGFQTDLIGYGGSNPIPSLERLPRLRIHYLPEPPLFAVKRLPFLLAAPIKIIHQIASILVVLCALIEVPPEFILVQNPPSIPTLLLVQFVGRIRGCKVIIDWHNLGYSILALKLGPNHPLVRVAKWFEKTFGRNTYAHLFVTQAMKHHLIKEWDLQGKTVVLHDRPPSHFHRASPQESHELFCKLGSAILAQPTIHNFLPPSSPPFSTPFTTIKPKQGRVTTIITQQEIYSELRPPILRPDRPALLVSSTSWTPDEDFSILIDALTSYELRAVELSMSPSSHKLPKIIFVVTGKGPLRDKYMKEISLKQSSWKWVKVMSLWLEAEDYPILLGSADLGVCLHSSSSALDLPMKVVDMFGCGLPVCALKFDCLPELVKHEVNGLIFSDATQLAKQFEELLTSFPDSPTLSRLASSLTKTRTPLVSPSPKTGEECWMWSTWEENWKRVMRPLILNDVNL